MCGPSPEEWEEMYSYDDYEYDVSDNYDNNDDYDEGEDFYLE